MQQRLDALESTIKRWFRTLTALGVLGAGVFTYLLIDRPHLKQIEANVALIEKTIEEKTSNLDLLAERTELVRKQVEDLNSSSREVRYALDLMQSRANVTSELVSIIGAFQPNFSVDLDVQRVKGKKHLIFIYTIRNHGRYPIRISKPQGSLSLLNLDAGTTTPINVVREDVGEIGKLMPGQQVTHTADVWTDELPSDVLLGYDLTFRAETTKEVANTVADLLKDHIPRERLEPLRHFYTTVNGRMNI